MTESRVLQEIRARRAAPPPVGRRRHVFGWGAAAPGGISHPAARGRAGRSGIHSAVDTCGAASAHDVDRVADAADLLLYDLKHLDDDHHRRITGSSNREILDNLRRAVRRHAAVRIRFTLVPGVNDDEDHLRRLAGFVSSLGLSEIDVLPYRNVVAEEVRGTRKGESQRAASRSLVPIAVAAAIRSVSRSAVWLRPAVLA